MSSLLTKKDTILVEGYIRDVFTDKTFFPIDISNLILLFTRLALHTNHCKLDPKSNKLIAEPFEAAHFISKIPWKKGQHKIEIKCLNDSMEFGVGICSDYLQNHTKEYFLEAKKCGISYYIKVHRNYVQPSLCHFKNGGEIYRKYFGGYRSTKDFTVLINLDLDNYTIEIHYCNTQLTIDNQTKFKIEKRDVYYFGFHCFNGKEFEIIQCS